MIIYIHCTCTYRIEMQYLRYGCDVGPETIQFNAADINRVDCYQAFWLYNP